MKITKIFTLGILLTTFQAWANIVVSELNDNSQAADSRVLEEAGIRLQDVSVLKPQVLSPEERRLMAYLPKLTKINDQWALLYEKQGNAHVVNAQAFIKNIEEQNSLRSLPEQTVVYRYERENGTQSTLLVTLKRNKELVTEINEVINKVRSTVVIFKTPLNQSRSDYQVALLNKLLEVTLLKKEEVTSEYIQAMSFTSIRPYRYISTVNKESKDSALFALVPKANNAVQALQMEINPSVSTSVVTLKDKNSSLSLEQVITGEGEVTTAKNTENFLFELKDNLQSVAMKQKLEFVRKDMEQGIITANASDISFAVSNLLDLLEEWPVAWELMPAEFLDEETLVDSFTGMVQTAHALGMTNQILKFIETQFDASNEASILNPAGYETVTSPHPVIQKKCSYGSIYMMWIGGAMKLWIENNQE